MKLNNVVSVDSKFQSSVNLEYDLNNIDKIESYIPTEQSVNVLDRFLKEIYFPKNYQRSNVLVGPYGRGKSHLLLVLSAIVSLDMLSDDRERAKRVILSLADKVEIVNSDTAILIRKIVESKIRLLPVIINSNSTNINQSIILALKEALDYANLSSLLPETHFDSAISVMKMWEHGYPEAYSVFKSELSSSKLDIKSFEVSLKNFDFDAYQKFCEIYPKVAAGTTFNPFANADVVKLVLSVNEALKRNTEYNGIFIIFDEFSKFVESNLDKSRMFNFKIIQDLAEATQRCTDPQLHFTCVTHKALLDYSSSDSFKTVEGRFDEIDFVASSEQSYELIANAIIKKPEYNAFKTKYQHEFSSLLEESSATGIFSNLSENALENKLVYGCFPIAPLTAYTLLRVSEKVGQNERTIFTFMAQNEHGTLMDFINTHDDFSLVTVDAVFDYFQESFKKEVFNSAVHSMWSKANSALHKISDSNAQLIIKALAVIGIVADERLRPISTHIKLALNLSSEEFENAISCLIAKDIIAQRESSEFVFLTANGIDIQNSITNYIATKLGKFSSAEFLNTIFDGQYCIPRQYNDDYNITRYFKVVYMDGNVFLKTKHWQQLTENISADGIIINIVSDNQCHKDIIAKLKEYVGQKHIIVCLTQGDINETLLKQLSAIMHLKESIIDKNDVHYQTELEIFEEDIRKKILKHIEGLYSAESQLSSYFNCDGELVGVKKQVHLIREISKICSDVFSLTPNINNELINKRNVTAPIKKARESIVNHLLRNAEEAELPMIYGAGPDASIFNSVFVATGLSQTTLVDDKGLASTIEYIDAFIRSAEVTKKELADLYNTLLLPPYGIRNGLIPLLIAYVIRQYQDNVIIYYGKNEVELSASTLNLINECCGAKYQILLEIGTSARNTFIGKVYNLFGATEEDRQASINSIYNVVRCMQSWLRALPGYTKRCGGFFKGDQFVSLTEDEMFFRKELLKFEINSRELLFGRIFANFENDYSKYYHWIKSFKEKMDGHIATTLQQLETIIKTSIDSDCRGESLATVVDEWKNNISENTLKHIFPTDVNRVLSVLLAMDGFDSEKLVMTLCKVVTGISIFDWNDATYLEFTKQFVKILEVISNYEQSASDSDDNGFKLTINGKVFEKSFASVDRTPIGSTVQNNIEFVLDEYADAVSPEEKIDILLNLIQKLVN